jgi:purine-binding chemotaxis protein CheW
VSAPNLDAILAERGHGTATGDATLLEENSLGLVIFTLSDQAFAFPGTCVREILVDPPVYRVPGAPSALEGVISVRGEIESVLCLRALLQLPASTASKRAVLLTRGEHLHTGLRVDEVIDLVSLPERALQPAPESLPGNLRPYVTHLTRLGERGVSLLGLDRLLAAYAAHADDASDAKDVAGQAR